MAGKGENADVQNNTSITKLLITIMLLIMMMLSKMIVMVALMLQGCMTSGNNMETICYRIS